mgnify:CR=1 FL=1
MAIIKTAILQTHVYTDKSRNITQAAELLASPELQGTDLAVLPEMFCCPYENKYFPEYAEPSQNPDVRHASMGHRSICINAQTCEAIDPYDDSKERMYCPEIITWEDIQ